jgi:hypothetical protein
MSLQAGALDVFDNFVDADCMARYMEDAMPAPPTTDDSGKHGRREFLIAISTGVIAYLRAHQGDDFRVLDLVNNQPLGRLEIL